MAGNGVAVICGLVVAVGSKATYFSGTPCGCPIANTSVFSGGGTDASVNVVCGNGTSGACLSSKMAISLSWTFTTLKAFNGVVDKARRTTLDFPHQ